MIQKTVEEIEARLKASSDLAESTRLELLSLLAVLKGEVDALSETHDEAARSVAGFVEVSAHEATRQEPDPRLVRLSLEGLRTSVTGFEESHPRLFEVVNRICTTLANLGI